MIQYAVIISKHVVVIHTKLFTQLLKQLKKIETSTSINNFKE